MNVYRVTRSQYIPILGGGPARGDCYVVAASYGEAEALGQNEPLFTSDVSTQSVKVEHIELLGPVTLAPTLARWEHHACPGWEGADVMRAALSRLASGEAMTTYGWGERPSRELSARMTYAQAALDDAAEKAKR